MAASCLNLLDQVHRKCKSEAGRLEAPRVRYDLVRVTPPIGPSYGLFVAVLVVTVVWGPLWLKLVALYFFLLWLELHVTDRGYVALQVEGIKIRWHFRLMVSYAELRAVEVRERPALTGITRQLLGSWRPGPYTVLVLHESKWVLSSMVLPIPSHSREIHLNLKAPEIPSFVSEVKARLR